MEAPIYLFKVVTTHLSRSTHLKQLPCSIIMGHATFEVADVLAGNEEIVHTSYGPVTVTFYGDRSKSPCLAYHEAGLNHRTCFHSLIAASGPQSLLLKNFCIVFIDAPGCQVTLTEQL